MGKINIELHKRFLTILLTKITKAFSTKVALKGGTCAYFFYDLPRFSYDLDFDVLKDFDDSDRDLLKEILARDGRIKDYKDKKFTLFLLFDYGKGYPNIKIELNKRTWVNNNYKKIWFLGIPLIISDEPTILTNKMVAITDRRTPVARDLFDVYYFLKLNFPLNNGLIKERTGKNTYNYLNFLIDFINKTYNAKNILQGLGEIIDGKQKLWVKEHLIDEVINEINKRV
jgi:predicted nucleotidyltransferase component of viral defense system